MGGAAVGSFVYTGATMYAIRAGYYELATASGTLAGLCSTVLGSVWQDLGNKLSANQPSCGPGSEQK